MLQLKPVLLSGCAITLSAIVGLVGAQAQTSSVQASQPASPASKTTAPQMPAASAQVQVAENARMQRGERMVCKEEVILGTRLKGIRTCRTANEWRRLARGFQARLKETNDRAGAAFSGN